ncbi:MAG: hypothetical protein NTV46_07730 [Verrucomicrobia bacterium]|nr:hypothetical protein [Verrucomicrobiota bacterium]
MQTGNPEARSASGEHPGTTTLPHPHAGKYQTGSAEIRCMYAPEFNAHSASFLIDVRPSGM